jgi:hypothetical protein
MTNELTAWWPRFARLCAQVSVAAFALTAVTFAVLMVPMVWDIVTQGRHVIRVAPTWTFGIVIAILVFLPVVGVFLALVGIRHAPRLARTGLVCNGLWVIALVCLPFIAHDPW